MQEAFYLSANLRRRNTWSPFHGKCDYVYVVGWGVCNVIESRDIFVDGSLFRPIAGDILICPIIQILSYKVLNDVESKAAQAKFASRIPQLWRRFPGPKSNQQILGIISPMIFEFVIKNLARDLYTI